MIKCLVKLYIYIYVYEFTNNKHYEKAHTKLFTWSIVTDNYYKNE